MTLVGDALTADALNPLNKVTGAYRSTPLISFARSACYVP